MLKEAAGIQRVVLKTGRTDLRRGIDGLKAIIILNGMDPLEKGTLFRFCGRKNDRIRGLTVEGDGYLLMTKRLSGENRFQWPRNEDDMRKITMEQYRNLMEGFAVEGSIREV
jgi:transposase